MANTDVSINTNLIREICNQILSLTSDSNMIILFPRPDFKGLGYIPQLFFIYPKEDYLEINLTSTSSEKAIINFEERKGEFASYNIISQPEQINLTKGTLTSLYDPILVQLFKKTPFLNNALRFNKNLVKSQFKERFKAGVYYSMFSASVGFYETVVITNLKLKDTPFIDEIEIELGIKIMKTFNIMNYIG